MSKFRNTVARLMDDHSERVGLTRRPLQRIYAIHDAIRTNQYPNCTTLADMLEVTAKTIQRDVNWMRDEFHLPLEYDDKLHGFYYSRDVSDFPVFGTTAEELAGLFLARNALDAVRGTPLAEAMRGIFAKLTRAIEGNVSFQWGDLDAAFSKKPAEQKPDDVRLFGELAQALLERREISFLYRKLSESVAVPRRLQGYYLGELDGAWYLIGRDLDRAALRMFALPRISRLKILNKTFSVPSGFDGKACLMRSFGIWNAPGDGCRQVVRVELRDYAAGLAQERRWHPTQEVRAINSKGTRVEVMFEVGSRLEDVARWVLSFGSKAKVLAPPTLINLVHDEVIAMAGS